MTDDDRNDALDDAAEILSAELERAGAENSAELAEAHRALALNTLSRAGMALDLARRLLTEAQVSARAAGEDRAADELQAAFLDLVRVKVRASRALAGPVVAVWPDAELVVPKEWGDS